MTIASRAVTALAIGALPVLLYAFSSGPDPRYTGAPGDLTCAVCHTGSRPPSGSVQLKSSAGTNYTPGQQQTLTITISDSDARVYGFEITARLDSDPSNAQAGGFTAGT